MVSIIHMESDEVRGRGQMMMDTAADFIELISRLRYFAGNLGHAWKGSSAVNYVRDVDKLIGSIRAHSLVLDELGKRVIREVDEWVNADQFNAPAAFSWGRERHTSLPPYAGGRGNRDWMFYLGGFGTMVLDGVHYATGVIRDQWGRVLKTTEDIANTAIRTSDSSLDSGFTALLGNPLTGDSESISLELKGDVTLPGVEVGVPGSFKLAVAKQATLTKKNGKYYLKLTGDGGIGLEEPFLEAKGGVKLGKDRYGIDIESSVEAMVKGQVEVEYEFEPQKPGDMTKMAGYMYGLGLATSIAGLLASPPLPLLAENIKSIKTSGGVVGEGKANASALFKLIGVDGKVDGMQGGEVRRNDAGNWEVARQIELDADVKSLILVDEYGTKSNVQVESIIDPATGRQSTKVIVELQSSLEGQNIEVSKLGKYLLDMKKSPVQGGDISSANYKGVKVEYKVDEPTDMALEMLKDPQKGWEKLKQNSHVDVYAKSDAELGLGADGKVAIPSQKVGFSMEVNGVRGSEKEIYSSE